MQLIPNLKSFLSQGNPRTRKAKQNILAMFVIKGLSILIGLAFVPIMMEYLNTTRYGIWLTITSLLTWFSFFDIGLGNGMRNRLSEALSENNIPQARSYISTTYITLSAIMGTLLLLFFAVNPFINWSTVLNAPPEMAHELSIMILSVFALFCIQFTLKLLNTMLLSLQRPALGALLDLLGQALGLLLILFTAKALQNVSLLSFGVAFSIAPVLILAGVSLTLFRGKYRYLAPSFRYFRRDYVHNLFSLGSKFFIIQVSSIFLYQTNNIIIAQVVGPVGVTDFNIAYKYIFALFMIFSVIATPIWSAVTDAYHRNEIDWIRKTFRYLNYIWLAFVGAGIIMLIAAKLVYKLWINDMVLVNYAVLVLVLAYFLLLMRHSIYSSFINGVGKIGLLSRIVILESLVHIPLAVILGQWIGIPGVLISMVLITLVNAIWEPIQYRKISSGTARGIWNQ